VFIRPAASNDDWNKTNLWRAAQSIPGATLFDDLAGAAAASFHARASGETLFYDSAGQLAYQGGLTPARGHRGESAGCSALESAIAGLPTAQRQFPVFGCSLRDRCAPPASSQTKTP
jgi:hypothetical protein